MADKSYIGKGSVFIKKIGVSGPARNIGNVHQFDVSQTLNERSLADFESISGGEANSGSRIDTVTATIQMRDVSAENLALGGLGKVTTIAAGTVTDEAHTGYKGGFLRTAFNIDTAVAPTVTGTGGTPTYVAGTDYTVRSAGIYITESSTIPDATALEISYTKKGGKRVDFMVEAGAEYEVTFAGLNEAQAGTAMTGAIWRFKPSPFQTLSLMGDDYAALDMTGKILRDATKTGADESQFYVVEVE